MQGYKLNNVSKRGHMFKFKLFAEKLHGTTAMVWITKL